MSVKIMPIRKRILMVLMLAAVPLAYSEPLSLIQEIPLISAAKWVTNSPKSKAVISFHTGQRRFEIASWYSEKDPFINKHTANGEIFDDRQMTCASWDYPFGTRLQVVNLANGKTVACRVNDRGPSKRLGRKIDLTKAAFHKIADLRKGLIRVSVAVLKK